MPINNIKGYLNTGKIIKKQTDKPNVLNYWLKSWIKNQGLSMILLRKFLVFCFYNAEITRRSVII